jgi:acyl-CoA thioester hydrolase
MYSLDVTPRFGDIDGLRHVNNTVIPGWFEQARNPIYRIFNPEFDFEHWNLILARFEVDFIRQIYFNKDVTIKTWVSRIGRSSFEIYQEAVQEGQLCAKGKVIHVYYDFDQQKSIVIPAHMKATMSEHLHDGEGKTSI